MATAWTVAAALLLTGSIANAKAETRPECVLSLVNGDRVRGTVVGMADGSVSFRPAVAPETTILIDLRRIKQLAFSGRGAKTPDRGEVLTLHDGSVLYGRFVRLGEDALRFDAA